MSEVAHEAGWGQVGAVVLAAGQSRRMGRPKLLLPWREGRTVIEWVVETLLVAGVGQVIVVTGATHEDVRRALASHPVRLAYNPDFAAVEMVRSLQVGIRASDAGLSGLLVVLGDQPLIEQAVIRQVMRAHTQEQGRIIIPSYQMRRGHPWLVDQSLLPDVLNLPVEASLRDFLRDHAAEIDYVNVDSESILKDMDTPDDYDQLRRDQSG